MTKQTFNIEEYWKVIVFYDVDYTYFSRIVSELVSAGTSTQTIRKSMIC